MKQSMLASLLVVLSVSFALVGCQNEGARLTGPETSDQQTPQFLQLPSDQPLMKGLSDTEEITVNNGGQLRIHYTEPNPATGKKACELDVKLTFDRKSVTNDFEACLQMDAQYLMNMDAPYLMYEVDLEFGPHRTIFIE